MFSEFTSLCLGLLMGPSLLFLHSPQTRSHLTRGCADCTANPACSPAAWGRGVRTEGLFFFFLNWSHISFYRKLHFTLFLSHPSPLIFPFLEKLASLSERVSKHSLLYTLNFRTHPSIKLSLNIRWVWLGKSKNTNSGLSWHFSNPSILMKTWYSVTSVIPC